MAFSSTVARAADASLLVDMNTNSNTNSNINTHTSINTNTNTNSNTNSNINNHTSINTRHWADRLPTVGVALASFYSLFTGDWGFRKVPEITSELHGCV